jgi:hypothetical protein
MNDGVTITPRTQQLFSTVAMSFACIMVCLFVGMLVFFHYYYSFWISLLQAVLFLLFTYSIFRILFIASFTQRLDIPVQQQTQTSPSGMFLSTLLKYLVLISVSVPFAFTMLVHSFRIIDEQLYIKLTSKKGMSEAFFYVKNTMDVKLGLVFALFILVFLLPFLITDLLIDKMEIKARFTVHHTRLYHEIAADQQNLSEIRDRWIALRREDYGNRYISAQSDREAKIYMNMADYTTNLE